MRKNRDLWLFELNARLDTKNDIIKKLQKDNEMLQKINQISVEENEKLIAVSTLEQSHKPKEDNSTQVDFRQSY